MAPEYRPFLRYLPSVLFGLFILVVSVVPIDFQETPSILLFPGFDKLVHAGMYAVLVFLLLIEILRGHGVTWFTISGIPSLVFVYSVLIEIIQHYLISSRSGEVLDIAANLGGTVAGVLAALLFHRIRS